MTPKPLPNYPVVVIHLEDPAGSGLAACCGLPWKKAPERLGDTLWLCTGCARSRAGRPEPKRPNPTESQRWP